MTTSNKLSFEQAVSQFAKENGLDSNIKTQQEIIQQFYNVPFYRWDLSIDNHYNLYRKGKCNCFNCIIKWPVKNGHVYPLFDYQQRYLSALEKHKLVAVIKCRASGISEITLRYMEWLALRNSKLTSSQFIIVSAPAEELSISFIRRIRQHLEPIFGTFESREKTLMLNGVRFETMPSHNLLRLRGITNVSFLALEESSFWHKSEEEEILPIILPLRQKNKDIQISLISTPGRLGSLMHQIHLAPESQTPFKKVYIDWKQVVGKLFTHQEIDEARRTNVAFEREMNLAFGFGMSNVFNPADLQYCVELGKRYARQYQYYPHTIHPESDTMIGVDFGAGGSSQFALVGLQIWNQHLHCFAAESYTRPGMDKMIDRIINLWKDGTNCRGHIYVDASAPLFIRSLKQSMSTYDSQEQVDYEEQIDRLRARGLAGDDDLNIGSYMHAIPVNFRTHGPRLLQILSLYVQRRILSIHPDFTNLITSLQSVNTKEHSSSDWSLDKSSYSHDLTDAMRAACFDLRVEHPKAKVSVTV